MTLPAKAQRVFIAALIGTILMSALPSVARSQVSEADATSTTDTLEIQTAEVSALKSPEYQYESIPSDGSIVGDFVLGPGKAELEIEPGQTKTVEITVTNRTGQERKFGFEVEDVTGAADGSTSAVLLGNERGPYTLKDYLDIPDAPITLGHNERVRIPITISIPADAEPGGRYGSVLVNTISKAADRDTTGAAPESPIIARVGTLFFITIPGDISRAGKLKDFTTIPNKSWFQKGPMSFSVLYENEGTIHVNPYGELRITNMFGEEVAFVKLDPWFALPKSLRFREVIWDREFLLGRYTATVHINRGYNDVIDTMELSFWVIPWKLAAGAFLGLFIFFYLIRFIFKNFEFKKKRK